MDQELQRIMKEIRDTCGIPDTDPDFNKFIAKTTFAYLMRRKEVNEYVKIFFDSLGVLAPQVFGGSRVSSVMTNITNISASSQTNPVPASSPFIDPSNTLPDPEEDNEVLYIWRLMDEQEVEATIID